LGEAVEAWSGVVGVWCGTGMAVEARFGQVSTGVAGRGEAVVDGYGRVSSGMACHGSRG
jgi:hypothetical protein